MGPSLNSVASFLRGELQACGNDPITIGAEQARTILRFCNERTGQTPMRSADNSATEQIINEAEEACGAAFHGNWPENTRNASEKLENLVARTRELNEMVHQTHGTDTPERITGEEVIYERDLTPPADDEPELVNHPKHYNSHPSGIECIEIIRHMTFNAGSVIKYLWRNGLKDANPPLQELRKAAWYLNDEIERVGNGEKTGKSN